jgi:hypothetical protein
MQDKYTAGVNLAPMCRHCRFLDKLGMFPTCHYYYTKYCRVLDMCHTCHNYYTKYCRGNCKAEFTLALNAGASCH